MTIKDDEEIISNIEESWTNTSLTQDDLKKVLITLKIVYRNPYLVKLGIIRQLFEQVIKAIEFFLNNVDSFNKNQIKQNVKEILKYIEKENILNSNSELIHEQINELGLKCHQLNEKTINKYSKNNKEFEKLRKKIAKKNIIKNHII